VSAKPQDLNLRAAAAIRHFRHLRELSQEDLAERASLDRTYISGVERGKRNVTLSSLERIIAALHSTNEEFLFEMARCSVDNRTQVPAEQKLKGARAAKTRN
jgi:transcriptional regulator with XRE-family HTH domain